MAMLRHIRDLPMAEEGEEITRDLAPWPFGKRFGQRSGAVCGPELGAAIILQPPCIRPWDLEVGTDPGLAGKTRGKGRRGPPCKCTQWGDVMSAGMTRSSILVGRTINDRSETLPSRGDRPIGPPAVPLPPVIMSCLGLGPASPRRRAECIPRASKAPFIVTGPYPGR